jgi:hypothetical protein
MATTLLAPVEYEGTMVDDVTDNVQYGFMMLDVSQVARPGRGSTIMPSTTSSFAGRSRRTGSQWTVDTMLIRFRSSPRTIRDMVLNLVAVLAVLVIGVFLLRVGVSDDGTGRPAGWNVFAGGLAVAFGAIGFALAGVTLAQQCGWFPRLVVATRQDGWILFSPINLLRRRVLRVPVEDPRVGLFFSRPRQYASSDRAEKNGWWQVTSGSRSLVIASLGDAARANADSISGALASVGLEPSVELES